MRRIIFILILFIAQASITFGQNESDGFQGFRLLRSAEDYSYLKDKTKVSFWESLKYINLGANSYLSIGGDLRTEGQFLMNELWAEGNDDQALFQRLMLHTDWHLSENFRIFGQLKGGWTLGRNTSPFPFDNDDLDIHQLFMSIKLGQSSLEVGRQELLYGSRRLIAPREGTNIRQSFDGLRWIWKNENNQLDILGYAYNRQRVNIFDNSINTDRLLWGIYYVWNAPGLEHLNFDLYYLGVDNNSALFEQGDTRETRHSFGVRHWGRQSALQFNNEFILQFGSFGSDQITAWTASTELYYHLGTTHPSKVGLKAEVISGDPNPNDGRLNTFNPLYPRGGYFGLLAIIGPANLMDIHPSYMFTYRENWSVSFDWDFFWRHQLGDGIYFPSGRLNLEGNASDRRFIGHQAGIQITRTISDFLEVEASYFYFFAGPFLNDITDGANFSQLGTSIYYKF